MKLSTLDEIKDRHIGPVGSPERTAYEVDLELERIGYWIRHLRLERQLTQEGLGKLVGVGKAQISKIENDTGRASLSTLFQVFDALGAKPKLVMEKSLDE